MTIKKLEGKERFEAHKLFVYCFHQRPENIEADREKRRDLGWVRGCTGRARTYENVLGFERM